MVQLLDQLHVDVRAESEPKEENSAQELPVEPAGPAVEPQLVESQDEQPESATTSEACCIPAPESSDPPGPSAGAQGYVRPPDITSTIVECQPNGAVVVEESVQEQKPADILDQVSFTDRAVDSTGPTKPPRHFTVEPDIVASTKKPPPSRPPPPSGGPPPRPPPPSWQSLPSKKSQECLRPSSLEGKDHCMDIHQCYTD